QLPSKDEHSLHIALQQSSYRCEAQSKAPILQLVLTHESLSAGLPPLTCTQSVDLRHLLALTHLATVRHFSAVRSLAHKSFNHLLCSCFENISNFLSNDINQQWTAPTLFLTQFRSITCCCTVF
ncbi:hypothetical protein L9F63_006235, partial [Diploptera punctata]